jgi:anti-anti-sigma factor
MEGHAIEVGTTSQKAFVRVKGRGDFQNSQVLKDFINAMIEKGLTEFLIDLKDCRTMDSTFMGVLAGTALQLKNKYQKKLTLYHVEEHNLKLLTTLGIHIFMNIIPNEPGTPSQFEELPVTNSSKENLAQEMLKAHAILMEISEENRVKFKDVYEYLKEEIKKRTS